MSVQFDPVRQLFVVRWYEHGTQRSRRFVDEADAISFDRSRSDAADRTARDRSGAPSPGGPARARSVRRGDGVYAYETKSGIRWRFVFRQSDGSLSSRRGFPTRAAAVAARRALVESIRRGEVKVARETFESFWIRALSEKRAHLTTGGLEDLLNHGRKRLLPFFGSLSLSDLHQ